MAITPNMHLHVHISTCTNDYGSVYNFWLFSYEHYNGILGNYLTNKRSIAEQLMQKFMHQSDSFNRDLPTMYKDKFEGISIFDKHCSEMQQSDGTTAVNSPLTFCVIDEISNDSICKIPSLHKTSVLGLDDYQNLKQTYAYLYNCNVTGTQMTKTIKI